MKLLFGGGTTCDQPTLKRLFLIGTELVFMDRPSVNWGKWGTIGHRSPLRQVDSSGEVIKISVQAPPSGPAGELYEQYAVADIENAEFTRQLLDGLRRSGPFTTRLIQPDSNYAGDVVGQNIIDALVSDPTITPMALNAHFDPRRMFNIQTIEERRATLRNILVDASIQVTSALVVADEIDASPVSDDPCFLQLLSQRTSSPKYVGGSSPNAWLIGVEFVKAVIPDEALQRLSIQDVLMYRRKTEDVFQAWTNELNQIAARIDDLSVSNALDAIPKLIITELHPRISSYKAEMASARDALFPEILKAVTDWKVPALSFGSMATLGFASAVTAFAASAVTMAAGPAVEFWKSRRTLARKHAVSYLVGIA
jgi:hypothetical protein